MSDRPGNSVWLALNFADFQGYELRGIFTTREAAAAEIDDLPERNQEVLEISLNTPIREWMGA